jgi:hypothetical protein
VAQLSALASDGFGKLFWMDVSERSERLAEVVRALRDDVRNPWYALRPEDGTMPASVVDELVAVAIRRWRSRNRRAGGRSDAVADLANGLHAHFSDVVEDRQERDDWMFLARELAPVLDAKA